MVLRRLRSWWNPAHEPVAFYEPLRSQIVERLRAGDTIGAMRIANRGTGIGLVATKRSVEHLAELERLNASL